jgi:hypothetical protein
VDLSIEREPLGARFRSDGPYVSLFGFWRTLQARCLRMSAEVNSSSKLLLIFHSPMTASSKLPLDLWIDEIDREREIEWLEDAGFVILRAERRPPKSEPSKSEIPFKKSA